MTRAFPILENGCWFQCLEGGKDAGKSATSALFLDRDGVIISDTGYIKSPEKVVLLEGVSRLISEAVSRGMAVCIVTNQSGIGRGWSSWADFDHVQNRMFDLLEAETGLPFGGISLVCACPFHPTEAVPPYRANHDWRKPGRGMVDAACDYLLIDRCTSVFVGDKPSDIQAAKSAGISKRYLVSSQTTEYGAPGIVSLSAVELPSRKIEDSVAISKD